MNEEFSKKIKNPVYLIWLIIRSIIGLNCAFIGYISLNESGFINFILWMLLAAQFWLDGSVLKGIVKVNRFIVVVLLMIFILITT
ncbi:hypothetical protein D0C16_12910 [Cellvibrio sp. KY-GH-1]|uniref:hypothetical protein n=1 Tax=Cellvibrio sp. KY-GH-1 TaxID=2303332 RepID=UPI001246EEF3|nr:hypothetical protein [Cellvibrio sp. KY-GH-1]QEY16791.1 hypothetical protein D0C16_12910 [Cellvibrio sp. KY-GH-1]